MSIELVMPSNHLILCCPLLLLSIFPSIRVFFNESILHIRWTKYWSFIFSISLSNEYSRLISFRADWFALLAIKGTFKSLLQYHSSKASILWHSAFFIVQLSHPYLTCMDVRRSIRYILNRVGFPGGSGGKESACNVEDAGSVPESGEGNGNPLQYSCLENSMDRGVWLATVRGVPKNWTRLSN